MITLKLTRDNARIIERDFLPYMIMLAQSKLRSAESLSNQYFIRKMFLSLMLEIQLKFKKKLLESSAKIKFTFSEAHAIAFYIFLMKRPVDPDQVYVSLLRQQVCDLIYKQLLLPIPEIESEM
jgi:hypothetical protein